MAFLQDIGKFIAGPSAGEIEADKARGRASVIDPFQQAMAEQYLQQNPDADFSSIPGLDIVQRRYQQKLINQGGPLYQKKTDEKGNTSYSPKKGAKEKLEAEKATNPVMMGPGGFERPVNSYKDFMASKIYEKKMLSEQGQGQAPTKGEEAFMNKYFGISDSSEGPKKPDDILKVRKLATDMVKAEKVKNGELSQYKIKDYMPSEDELRMKMPEATKFLYPNADVQMNPEKVKYDIELPDNISSVGQAREYLGKHMNPAEVDAWIAANVEAK